MTPFCNLFMERPSYIAGCRNTTQCKHKVQLHAKCSMTTTQHSPSSLTFIPQYQPILLIRTRTIKLMKRPIADRKCQMSWLSQKRNSKQTSLCSRDIAGETCQHFTDMEIHNIHSAQATVLNHKGKLVPKKQNPVSTADPVQISLYLKI